VTGFGVPASSATGTGDGGVRRQLPSGLMRAGTWNFSYWGVRPATGLTGSGRAGCSGRTQLILDHGAALPGPGHRGGGSLSGALRGATPEFRHRAVRSGCSSRDDRRAGEAACPERRWTAAATAGACRTELAHNGRCPLRFAFAVRRQSRGVNPVTARDTAETGCAVPRCPLAHQGSSPAGSSY